MRWFVVLVLLVSINHNIGVFQTTLKVIHKFIRNYCVESDFFFFLSVCFQKIRTVVCRVLTDNYGLFVFNINVGSLSVYNYQFEIGVRGCMFLFRLENWLLLRKSSLLARHMLTSVCGV